MIPLGVGENWKANSQEIFAQHTSAQRLWKKSSRAYRGKAKPYACWSIIKNSAEDVSDERAIDAFLAGLRRSDLMEEVGRTRPRMVSKLMEVANRFADGEDAYNNKRGRSPEVDRASRQRRRYRNGDNHARRN
jgi:hypothetical protein